jgi:hypothetical protein
MLWFLCFPKAAFLGGRINEVVLGDVRFDAHRLRCSGEPNLHAAHYIWCDARYAGIAAGEYCANVAGGEAMRTDYQVTIIDGFTEHSGDWALGNLMRSAGFAVMERECEQNWGHANEAALADIRAARGLAVYSFGAATAWDETRGWREIPGGQQFNVGVIVAGVLDWMKGQFSGWTAPKCFKRMYCFQPTKAFPSSQPLINAPWFNIEDPELKAKLIANPIANINCDSLFRDVSNPIMMHTVIQNCPEVLALILWLFETFLEDSPAATGVVA